MRERIIRSRVERAKWERFPPLQGRVDQPESVRGVGRIEARDNQAFPTVKLIPLQSYDIKKIKGSIENSLELTGSAYVLVDKSPTTPQVSTPDKSDMKKNKDA